MKNAKKEPLSILNKFEMVREIILRQPGEKLSLLDVGCRNGELKDYAGHLVQYTGVDLFQNPKGTVDLVLDVEKGLPVKDESFDFVVAMDILEHLNDFQAAVEELLRVTRSYLIIMLPNLAYAPLRLEFFLHGSFSRKTGKYNLKYSKVPDSKDRHRWLTVLSQTDAYMKELSEDRQIPLEVIRFYGSKKRAFFASCCRLFGLSPSWWVPSCLYLFKKIGSNFSCKN